jgi:mRNA interferase MazF
MARRYIPKQDDIIWVNHNPIKGREQSGLRPSFVLSHDLYNRIGFVVVCPITSKEKGYGGEVKLPSELNTKGVILSDQVRTLDWQQRKIEYAESTKRHLHMEVYEKVNAILQTI